jgi:leucyl aminopeptidase
LQNLSLLTQDLQSSQKHFAELQKIAEGIFLTRSVVSEPSNVIYPESLAKIAKDELSPLGIEVEILETAEMKKLEMNALLAVAQGSENKPKLVVLRWNGGNKTESPVAFVGKGVTFDSGGISLKPGDNMHEMRYDMAGSGTVLGLLKAVALNKLSVNVVGVMALVENMPSGSAQRPGDVVKSMSGQTIEVLNTDAEGRMILADALWYTEDRFKPEIIIDLATLTGAIIVALGHEFAGLFSNCGKLANQIIESSVTTGEKVWRMPMSDHFDEGINSDIADMQNIGKSTVRGGSIPAAQFRKRFVSPARWAHIDIAGVETTTDNFFICSKGATGFGVHLLYDFLCKNYVK